MNKKLIQLISSPQCKAISLFFMSALIIVFFSIAVYGFKTSDPEPKLQPIIRETSKEFSSFAANVDVGIAVRNFLHFSMVENKFVVNLLVWFKFDPDEIPLSSLEKFSFENGRILKKSSPSLKIIGSKTLAKYSVLVELKSALNYLKFPLEDHKLSFILTNNFITPYEVIFDVLNTDFVFPPDISIAGWKVHELRTSYGVDEDALNRSDSKEKTARPKAIFTIDFAKSGVRKAFIIFVPIFFAFFFSLLSLFLSLQNIVGRVKLSGASVGALLTYRFVIEGMMPKVGYFTTADHIYGVLIASAFTIFVIQIILTNRFNSAVKVIPPHHEAVKIRQTKPLKTKLELLNLIKDLTFVIVTFAATLALGIIILI